MFGQRFSRFILVTGLLGGLAGNVSLAQAPLDLPPGSRIEIKPADLPPPYATPSARNRSQPLARRDGRMPRVPAGFAVNIFAEGFEHARWLAVAPNGDVFLAEPRAGHIRLLRDADGDGRAEVNRVFVAGFQRPHGMAVRDGAL